jgi:hypothetical protein
VMRGSRRTLVIELYLLTQEMKLNE